MVRIIAAFGIFLAAGLMGGAARGQSWLATPGALGTSVANAGNFSLTLPPGNWTEVSRVSESPLQTGGAQSMTIESTWFAQIWANHVVAAMYVRSNSTRGAHGWRTDGQCIRRDVLFFSNASETDKTYDCLMINNSIFGLGDNPSEFWVTTLNGLTKIGTVPHTMVCAYFGMVSGARTDFGKVGACFNPTASGFADDPGFNRSASQWNKQGMTADHQAFIDKVAAWAKAYHDTVADSFH